MAKAGLGSRRHNEALIRAGRVRLNGRIARLGDKADPQKDRIEVDSQLLKTQSHAYVYVAVNKPKGVISSLQDELGEGRRTVRDLVGLPGHLYPVGRLDKQSSGLMLLTNDGELAHRLTHPSFGHEKTYDVVVEGKVSQESLERWRRGLWLDGRKTAPAKVHVVRKETHFTHLEIVMHEGRKRQIRRVANMLGHSVSRLVRVKIGPISLGKLKPGEWRYLSQEEIASLRSAVKQTASSPSNRRQRPHKKSTAGKHRQSKKRNSTWKRQRNPK